jgi:cysteine-rich repeat protein
MSRFAFTLACLALFSGCTLITKAVTDDPVRCAVEEDGTPCGNDLDDDVERVCVAHQCVARGCGDGFVEGDEICDDGNTDAADGCEPISCTYTCEVDADCNDDLVCNGVETCNVAQHVCIAGVSITCTPSDACHMASCSPITGACEEALIDGDHDGHAPTSAGACGTDCNDGDAEVNPDYPEVCGDAKDNNCANGQTDETVVTWYADCDGDSYALMGPMVRMACAKPATTAESTGCANDQGNWTTRNPNTWTTADCADSEPGAHPDPTGFEVGFHDATIPGTTSWDWNCANGWEQELPSLNGQMPLCLWFVPCDESCCTYGNYDWQDGTAPGCGGYEWYDYCGNDTSCTPDEWKQQRCR